MDFPPEIAAPLLLVVGAVMFYLLRQKDAAQQAEIKDVRDYAAAEVKKLSDTQEAKFNLLFKKRDEDVQKLHEHQVHVAEVHYRKDELDSKFNRLEASLTNSLDKIGAKVDNLSDALLAHMKEDKK